MTAVAFTILGCVLLASLGYVAWEMRHAVLHDDWAADDRTAELDAEWARAEVRAHWDRHVAEALAVANAEPVFSATIRAMPVSQSSIAVVELLVAERVLGTEIEDWLAGEDQ